MKRKEIDALKQKTPAELAALLKERKEDLRRLTLDLVAGKVKNVADVRAAKKDIARIETFRTAANDTQRS